MVGEAIQGMIELHPLLSVNMMNDYSTGKWEIIQITSYLVAGAEGTFPTDDEGFIVISIHLRRPHIIMEPCTQPRP